MICLRFSISVGVLRYQEMKKYIFENFKNHKINRLTWPIFAVFTRWPKNNEYVFFIKLSKKVLIYLVTLKPRKSHKFLEIKQKDWSGVNLPPAIWNELSHCAKYVPTSIGIQLPTNIFFLVAQLPTNVFMVKYYTNS